MNILFLCRVVSVVVQSFKDHFVYAPSQWETTLQCNVVSHSLGAYTEGSLIIITFVPDKIRYKLKIGKTLPFGILSSMTLGNYLVRIFSLFLILSGFKLLRAWNNWPINQANLCGLFPCIQQSVLWNRLIVQTNNKESIKTLQSLQWRHNECDGVLNHQPHDCLLNLLFRRKWKKTPKLHVTGIRAGNSPVTGEFPAQRASNAENVSIWWRHHDWTFVWEIHAQKESGAPKACPCHGVIMSSLETKLNIFFL